MSIFIASLAFTDYDTLALAKIGIVVASLLAAGGGILVLRTSEPDPEASSLEG
jgi:Na+/H+ antiporter NhaA